VLIFFYALTRIHLKIKYESIYFRFLTWVVPSWETCSEQMSPGHVMWWQRAWDLYSRSQVRVRACISCKSLGQLGFNSLIWTHKVRFLKNGVSSNPKLKKKIVQNNNKYIKIITTSPNTSTWFDNVFIFTRVKSFYFLLY
jgi:hypothetical protein